MRTISFFDKVLTHLDRNLSQMVKSYTGSINTKKVDNSFGVSSEDTHTQLSLKLMRVNHCGEICAQALYNGQALAARTQELEQKLLKAAEEEQQHLSWCKTRIQELGGHPSRLTTIFGLGSFGIGVIAGLMGDKASLGFIAETEHQVSEHLDNHIKQLPAEDIKSREILIKMRDDEQHHATRALEEGGIKPPLYIRGLMKFTAKIMTKTTPYF